MKDSCVILDAGHTALTPGKRSPYSGYGAHPEIPLYEYEFNRRLQDRLIDKLIKAHINYFVVTPDANSEDSLRKRYQLANKYQSEHPDQYCIFLSLHGNAAGDGKEWLPAGYWSAWTTKGWNNSDIYAGYLKDAAVELLDPYGFPVMGNPSYEYDFTVIKNVMMPAVLTENLFYTNPGQAKFMNTDEGIDILAEINFRGTINYLNSKR